MRARYVQVIDRAERFVELSEDPFEGSGDRVSFSELRASWRWDDGCPGPPLDRPETWHPFDCMGYPLVLRNQE
jgi:hypothetical protein